MSTAAEILAELRGEHAPAVKTGRLQESRTGKIVRVADLGLNAAQSAPRLEEMSIEEVEAFLIKKTLARCDGNARKAAEELGLSRSAFYRRLEKHGL